MPDMPPIFTLQPQYLHSQLFQRNMHSFGLNTLSEQLKYSTIYHFVTSCHHMQLKVLCE